MFLIFYLKMVFGGKPMEIRNKSMTENINNICSLIHSVTKLDIEFIDDAESSALKLFDMQIPSIMKSSRKQTSLFIGSFLKDKASNNFLFHSDSFNLSYLGIGVREDNIYKGAIIAGPFLCDIPDDNFISSIVENNKLSLGHRELLNHYYKAITIFSLGAYKNIGNMIVNLTTNPFIYAGILTSKNEGLTISNMEEKELSKEKLHSEIELNYRIQKELENAVEKGFREEAVRIFNLLRFNPTNRVPNNPLRAGKNLAFSLSSLLRTAAHRGGVSPVYLHNISDMYAVLIERVSSISELEMLTTKMVSDHCDLVKKHSTAGFSPNIRKAVDYINLNFDSALSLSIVAEKINLNPSYLSREFKKETGSTITDYINKRRVEEAKFLIDQNISSITEIALMVGFTNHNYFSTVFKQITNLTPTEYSNRSKR
jgi:AraC-like DNA-binding protein